MNTAKAFALINEALQQAAAGVNNPTLTRQALQQAESLQDHLITQNESTARTLRRCETLLANMRTDLAQDDHAQEIAEDLEPEVNAAQLTLLIEARTVCTRGGDTVEDWEWHAPVYVWGRDCDQCESDHISWIEPDLEAYTQLCADTYDSAEGPTTIRLMTPKEANEFKPSFRDRVMEARENGNFFGVTL